MPKMAAIAMIFVASFHSSALAVGSIKTQLKSGDPLGPFVITKLAGSEEDNIEPGERLCYRCRYGTSPMAIVFARETDSNVQALVGKISKLVDIHSEAQLKGLLALLGNDAGELKDSAVEIAKSVKLGNIPVVHANEKESESGLEKYFLSPDAALTVVLANDSRVVSVHAFHSTDELKLNSLTDEINRLVELGQE